MSSGGVKHAAYTMLCHSPVLLAVLCRRAIALVFSTWQHNQQSGVLAGGWATVLATTQTSIWHNVNVPT
jgi:hypothetical protein